LDERRDGMVARMTRGSGMCQGENRREGGEKGKEGGIERVEKVMVQRRKERSQNCRGD